MPYVNLPPQTPSCPCPCPAQSKHPSSTDSPNAKLEGFPPKLELDVSPEDTVANLKSRVEEATGLLHYQQRIFWSGKQLQDLNANLESYGMRENEDGKVHVARLVRTFPPDDWIPFQLEVRARHTFFMIEARPRDTMAKLKSTIERAQGWKAADLDLLFDDDSTVKESYLDEYSSLLLYGRKGSELYELLGGRDEEEVESDEDESEDESESEESEVSDEDEVVPTKRGESSQKK